MYHKLPNVLTNCCLCCLAIQPDWLPDELFPITVLSSDVVVVLHFRPV